MFLGKKDRVLLIKLFYENGGSLSTALHISRRLNYLRKGATSRQALKKKMIQKFKETGVSGVIRGRQRKRISNENIEDVTFTVVERESGSQYSASNARAVSRDFSPLVYSSKDFEVTLNYYPYKISFLEH